MAEELNLLGLDYGSVTVGVAGSDGLFLTAQPIEVIRRNRENNRIVGRTLYDRECAPDFG